MHTYIRTYIHAHTHIHTAKISDIKATFEKADANNDKKVTLDEFLTLFNTKKIDEKNLIATLCQTLQFLQKERGTHKYTYIYTHIYIQAHAHIHTCNI